MNTGSDELNEFGQPVGTVVEDWEPREPVFPVILEGMSCRLEPLNPTSHGDDLLQVYARTDPRSWTYLPYGPFESEQQFRRWLAVAASGSDLFFTVVERSRDLPLGLLALMRCDASNGVVEVGNIHFSDAAKGSRISTEAVFLAMQFVFDQLGYRRLEWKCNALNAPSRRAAERFGFRFEGIFRQAVVVKGRNRDTAWYAVMDYEWPALRDGYQDWLAAKNFDADNRQREKLDVFIVRHANG